MPRQPLPPDVLTQLVAAFERTGNVSEAARIVGVPRSTASSALLRTQRVTRRQLHARACEAGLRQGRKALRAELSRLNRYTTAAVGSLGEDSPPPSIEPRDYAALVRAQADLNRVLIQHDERVSARRTEALNREVTREKLKTLRGIGDLSGATDEELAALRAILERAKTRGPTASDQDRAGATEPVDAAHGEPR